MTFILWCILLVLCWPLALLALVVYPIVWLILLPFRILGDRGRRCPGIVARNFVLARARIAGAATHVETR